MINRGTRISPVAPEADLNEMSLTGLERLRKLSGELARMADLNRKLALAGGQALDLLQVESVSLILPSRRKNELFFRLVQGPGERVRQQIMGTTFPCLSLAGHVLNTGAPLCLREVENDSRFYPGVDAKSGFVTRNLIYVPLVTGDRVSGVLGAVNKLDGDFSNQDETLASLLADLLALHLENDLIREYKTAAQTDPLTGLPNRRYLLTRLKEELYRSKRNRSNFSVIFIDLDRLKTINDTHGHRAGDLALSALAQVLKQEIRITDTAARYGGDEFVVLLPDTDNREAAALASRLQAAVMSAVPEEPLPRVTASFGISTYSPAERLGDELELVRRADLAMLQAKQEGGNRVFQEIHPR